MYIAPTEKAKEGSIFDVHEMAYEFLLYPKREDTPTPMDADISIEGGNVVIEGSIMGSDVNKPDNAGFCKCVCSIRRFNQWYELEVPGSVLEEHPDLMQAIEDAGWAEVR